MNSLFPPELRTASVVKRWSIVRVQQPDSVAEHSWYVTFYATRIAQLVGWAGPIADLMFYALMHDSEELVTGDMVSPFKRAMATEGHDGYRDFVAEQMLLKLPLILPQMMAIEQSSHGAEIEAIVKVADKVDAVLYLIGEIRVGNSQLDLLLTDATNNLRAAWDEMFETMDMDGYVAHRDDVWNQELWPAIQAHHKHGRLGIV